MTTEHVLTPDDKCPCGKPQEGSGYCSYECYSKHDAYAVAADSASMGGPLSEAEREHMNLRLTGQLRRIATGEHEASQSMREYARMLVAEREAESLARRCARYFEELEQANARVGVLEGQLATAESAATVLSEIAAERARQDAKWGPQNHPDGTGPYVKTSDRLSNMEDEADNARFECQQAARDGSVTWRHILREEVYEAFAENDPSALRTELVQVAAVAVAWAEAIDRRALGLNGGGTDE